MQFRSFSERLRRGWDSPGVFIGGGGRIRTFDTLSSIAVFETARFNRSRTPPLHVLKSAGFETALLYPLQYLSLVTINYHFLDLKSIL